MSVLVFYGVDIFMLLWEPKKRGKINYGCFGNAAIVIWNFIKIIILNVINTSIIKFLIRSVKIIHTEKSGLEPIV